MVNNANWLLPEGVEEILPEEAQKLEMLRRSILDDLASRDFQLVMPPVMEFVDALLIGAEIFGIADESADIQVIRAMLQTLTLSEASSITLSLGHVGIYRALLRAQAIDDAQEHALRDVLIRKSSPDLDTLANDLKVADFQTLIALQGNKSVLDRAREELPDTPEIVASLEQLQAVITHLEDLNDDVNIHIDLADVSGYRYHTGLKYTAYTTGRGRAVAQGGRYDRIGQEFGRPRPATGFSADLKTLIKLG